MTNADMKQTRRFLMAATAGLLACPPLPAVAQADGARIVVPFPPGGPADTLVRLLIESGLGEGYGRKLVVDNKPGAGGLIGTQAVARAPADGSTFLLTPTFFLQNAIIHEKPGYDPFGDFVAVSGVGTTYAVFAVNADHPAKTLAEFVTHVRQQAGAVSYASAGAGTATHLAGFTLGKLAAVNLNHVPYRGEAPAVQDLLGGHVSCGFFAVASVQPYVASSRLRILAVAQPQRMPEVPDVPTMGEAGLDHPVFHTVGWFGLFAPAGTPPALVHRMAATMTDVLGKPALMRRLVDYGMQPWSTTLGDFAAMLRRDYRIWQDVIAAAGLKASVE